jgi:uncharacterized RDD family membrane protein YckC
MSGFDALTKDSKAQDYWLKRLVAFVIDAIIVYAVLAVIAVVVALPFLFFGALTGGGFGPAAFIFGGIFSLLSGLIFVLYFTVAESSTGASIGKRIFNFKVASKTGTNPGLGESFIRNLSKIYWLLLLLDVAVGLALSKGFQQKYSDRFLGTSVVSRSP